MSGLALMAVAWVVAAPMIDNVAKLPSLASVLQRAIELAPSDEFLRDFGDSMTALLIGLLPALLAGVFFGMIAGMSKGTRWLFGPFAVTLGATPLILLVPLFFAWWGVSIATRAVAVFVMVGFPIMNMVMVATGTKRLIPKTGSCPASSRKLIRVVGSDTFSSAAVQASGVVERKPASSSSSSWRASMAWGTSSRSLPARPT
jgi:ABC-type nitrate/sulfonate/bicarbonate transport system permease component